MRAGKLRHRVEIQKPVGATNAVGERIGSWDLVDTVWASVEEISAKVRGGERFLAGQVLAETSHMITMRFRTMDPSWRLVFGQRIFNISSFNNWEQRNIHLVVYVEEVV